MGLAYDALKWYGRPDFYHAIAFYCDPPCGGFDKDFSQDALVELYGYDCPKPGKLAREAIDRICHEYGDLQIIYVPADDEDYDDGDEGC